jgi:uncharacterized glyoxalase superfamily protein PhnB
MSTTTTLPIGNTQGLVKPAYMPWVSPCLVTRDPAAALEFFERAFGFQKREVYSSADGKILHAEVTWHDVVIMFGPECEQSHTKAPVTLGAPPSVSLYLYCDDVDAQYARATAAGAKIVQAPQDMFWGDRVCRLNDPDGHLWCFATHTGRTAPFPC